MINYYLITKPGIVLGNLITVAAGFLLASKGNLHLPIFIATLLGLGLIMASACVFNNYIDKPLDQKMERTKKRPLVIGSISDKKALIFAFSLGGLGFALLFFMTNWIATLTAFFGFFVYVILYSGWKSKTIYGTAIGSIAGAVPPVVGYTAISNQIDLGAILLFAMLVLWQMPHFFAIALYRLEDYAKASIPVLPLKKGILRTKIHMLLYIIAFIGTSVLLFTYHYTGSLYLYTTLAAGTTWLIYCLKGFQIKDATLWGKSMFRVSLVVITVISLAVILDPLALNI